MLPSDPAPDTPCTSSVRGPSRYTFRYSALKDWAKYLPISPNRPLALAALLGFTVEAVLLGTGEPDLYQMRPATMLFGLAFLGWFWASLTWVLEGAGRFWRHLDGRRPVSIRTRLASASLSMLLATFALLYAISWVLFVRSGRFANLETLRFVYANADHLWDYVVAAEPQQVIVGAIVTVGTMVSLPRVLAWSVRVSQSETTRNIKPRLLGWGVLTLMTCVCWRSLPPEPSVLRNSARVHVLSHGLHPGFTLYASHLASAARGRIEPHLDASRLRQLADVPEPLRPAEPVDGGARPSIIFVAVESLRADVVHQVRQGREITPNINRLARSGVELTRAYAQSTHSDYADPCLVSSLYPLRSLRHHYYGPRDPWPVQRIYDVLKPYGYTSAIISSQNEAWGGMDHFLTSPNLDLFFHPERNPDRSLVADRDPGFSREVRLGGLVAGKFPDAYTADQAIDWINAAAANGQPFFLSMNLQSSHFPYLMPDEVARPFQPCELSSRVSFVDYPIEETESVRNAYFNAIHECDRQIGRLVAALENVDRLDNTILVVTGENGEAFHECGSVTHAREPVEPAIHVACVMHAPQRLEPRVEDYPFEHVDLVPTVLSLADIPLHPNFQGIDIFAKDRPSADHRLLFCHVLSSLCEADSVMLGGRWKLTQDRRSGRESLYDVQHDPGQQHDLLPTQPQLADRLRSVLTQWRHQQLAYYHFPAYYLRYFPPPPPVWEEVEIAPKPTE